MPSEANYNSFFAHYIIDVSESLKAEENLYGKFLWETKFKGYQKVLDVGCGRCWFVRARPENCVGVDSNPIIVDHYRKEGLNVMLGSAYEIPFPDGHFDAVFCNYLLEHLLQPEKAFEEFYRVLKPGGLLYVTVPSPRMLTKGFFNDWTHVKPYSRTGAAMLARTVGFSQIQAEYDICRLAHATEQHYGGIFATTRVFSCLGWKAYSCYLKLLKKLGTRNRKMVVLEAWK